MSTTQAPNGTMKPLADLRTMSNQEIFSIVYRGLHMQGFYKAMRKMTKEGSDRKEFCAYYDPETNRRCAAGQLFPGERLPDYCQTVGPADLNIGGYVLIRDRTSADGLYTSQMAFIASLQRLHDQNTPYKENCLEDRVCRMDRYALFAIEQRMIIPQNLPQGPIKDLYPILKRVPSAIKFMV